MCRRAQQRGAAGRRHFLSCSGIKSAYFNRVARCGWHARLPRRLAVCCQPPTKSNPIGNEVTFSVGGRHEVQTNTADFSMRIFTENRSRRRAQPVCASQAKRGIAVPAVHRGSSARRRRTTAPAPKVAPQRPDRHRGASLKMMWCWLLAGVAVPCPWRAVKSKVAGASSKRNNKNS